METDAGKGSNQFEGVTDEKAGRIISRAGEWSTQALVIIGRDVYYRHKNGGRRGAYESKRGEWDRPIEPSRIVSQQEATMLLLDWGYEPEEIRDLLRTAFSDERSK